MLCVRVGQVCPDVRPLKLGYVYAIRVCLCLFDVENSVCVQSCSPFSGCFGTNLEINLVAKSNGETPYVEKHFWVFEKILKTQEVVSILVKVGENLPVERLSKISPLFSSLGPASLSATHRPVP